MIKKILPIFILAICCSISFAKVLNMTEYTSLKRDLDIRLAYIESITEMPKWSKTKLEDWKIKEKATVLRYLGNVEQKKEAYNLYRSNVNLFTLEQQKNWDKFYEEELSK